MDERLRALEREAQGDPAARVALLCARVRSGTLSQERLELAAYCSEPSARLAVPGEPGPASLANAQRCAHDPGLNVDRAERPCATAECLALWVRGLSRWGAEVLVRAAVAAARCALAVWASGECEDAHSSHPDWQAPLRHLRLVCGNVTRTRRTIETAEAWLACPCDSHMQAWRTTCSLVSMGRAPWLPHALTADQPERVESLNASMQSAARIAGEGPVREAIRSALVAWALQEADRGR